MANSKKKRKRLKRQLKQRCKQTGTGIVEPLEVIKEVTKETPKELFQKELDAIYNGAVTPLNEYLNEQATLCFKCESCGVRFFGKPSHIIGKESQRHLCNMPYGDKHGERLCSVRGKHKAKKKKKSKNTEQRGKALVKQLDELLDQGLNYIMIRKETGVNIQIVKYYAETFYKKPAPLKEEPAPLMYGDLTVYEVNNRGRKSFVDQAGKLFLECSKCKEIKSTDNFHVDKKGFLGKHSKCKECQKAFQEAKR